MGVENSQSLPTVQMSRSVYVVDDDFHLRRSLHFLLETRQISVLAYEGGTQFLSELETLDPAPVLLDVRMPKMAGTDVLEELKNRKINWPVIMLTGHGEISTAVHCLKLGAIDFLEKPVRSPDLLEVIEAAFQLMTTQATAEVERLAATSRLALLTPREFQVVDMLCCGRSNKQVAFELSISTRTVEMHRANAFKQLNVRSLVDAIALRAAADR